MRAVVARQLRKAVYGDDSPRVRQYLKTKNGAIVAGRSRYQYQQIKKMYKRGEFSLSA